ncbi:RNA polymerase sigma factor [Sinomicrobium weinanense]|uniref:Sigma-70 family RNA polymerase sigma factor n=1 Tax=Sinomicrobium weinanense TaxID=2842200 RepID=A0A926JPJ7_9FLAO|nr:sigma-70 family RNA polymerase sigma factor [Sinomicrobium weinanense]MBC9795122.1 sigma-70 family RNA polymerase sigma factor [Sinomicrobium weinanense]MBU3123746.1 sigma-70 family RNA polymerase sigma factor [Sinomicrobium weinanense]
MDAHFSLEEIQEQDNISGNLMGQEEDMAGISEERLWLAFQTGNKKAFEMIYKNNVSHLYRYGLTLVRDKDLVMDVIQDYFVSLWEKRERLGQVKRIKPYLYKSVKRKIIARASKKRKLLSLVETEKHIEKSKLASSPEYDVAEREKELEKEQHKLNQALAKLNRKHQQLIHLRFNSGLGYDEIAEVMDMKVRNVYHHMSRAIELLNRYLGHLFSLALFLALTA